MMRRSMMSVECSDLLEFQLYLLVPTLYFLMSLLHVFVVIFGKFSVIIFL